MDIHNIALVRSFKINEFYNILKNNGVMKTESKLVILKQGDTLSEYASGLDRVFREHGIYDYGDLPATFMEYKEKTGDDDYMHYESLRTEKRLEQLRAVLPMKADYNSDLLWAVNGLVPDDSETNAFANNTFSTNDFAIIYGLEEIMNQTTAEVVSLMPTDTAVKGEIKLGSEATLIIRSSAYNKLTDEEKEVLTNIGMQVIVFDGDLKAAIDKFLDESDRFIREDLTLSREKEGFKDSPTKEETLSTLRRIASEYGIPFAYHFDMAMEEVRDYNYVFEFYLHDFMHYLESLGVIEFDYGLLEHYTRGYADSFGEKVIEFGVDKFKEIVQDYNRKLLYLKEQGLLPTPEEMLEAREKGDEIQVYSLIKEVKLDEKKIVRKDDLRELARQGSMQKLVEAIDEIQEYMDEKKKTEEKAVNASNEGLQEQQDKQNDGYSTDDDI